jgi:hypothetical protein
MKPPSYWNTNVLYHTLVDPEFACYSTQPILDSKYDEVQPEDIAVQQHHLSATQQEQLADVLRDFSILFNGEMGSILIRKFILRLTLLNHLPNSIKHTQFHVSIWIPLKLNCFVLWILVSFLA